MRAAVQSHPLEPLLSLSFPAQLTDDVPPSAEDAPLSSNALLIIGWFGGTVALGLVLWLNARSFRDTGAQRDVLVGTTLAAALSIIVGAAVLTFADLGDPARVLRWTEKLVALALWSAAERRLKSPLRRWFERTDGEFAPPWTTGLLAVFVVGTVWGLIRGAAYLGLGLVAP